MSTTVQQQTLCEPPVDVAYNVRQAALRWLYVVSVNATDSVERMVRAGVPWSAATLYRWKAAYKRVEALGVWGEEVPY